MDTASIQVTDEDTEARRKCLTLKKCLSQSVPSATNLLRRSFVLHSHPKQNGQKKKKKIFKNVLKLCV